MNIALISPSPKPFAVGGIEKLMLGLYANIDEHTDNKVELIKLPTEENGFWELLNSYEQFYNLNLDHFDMVISLKYPAWMVRHKNHVVYMAHHLRGLFDTYHFLNLPEQQEYTKYNEINEILDYVRNEKNNHVKDLDKFFKLISNLKEKRTKIPDKYFNFPGPFIREIVHYLDRWALSENNISRYTSISETVKKRKDYFPLDSKVDVIYPPTTMSNLVEGNYEYFLVVGRLDGPKRVEMIVNAVKHIQGTNLRLLIAGTGPEEVRLKELAGNDKRIEFLGYINNVDLVNLYKDALAIIYIPYDEDYGLVTVEAMKCAKPVITCSDSGGTTEFVQHGKTGLIARPKFEDLAVQIKTIAENPKMAQEMGEKAKQSVKNINWLQCINDLVDINAVKEKPISEKKNLVVLSTYPVFPKRHGGQLRIYNLYKVLSDEYNVTILSINDNNQTYHKVDGDLVEITIPKTVKHQEEEWKIEKDIGIPITDIVMEQLIQYTPEYINEFNKIVGNTEILVASHPYLFNLIEPYQGKKKLIYDSHNVEYNLKKSMLPQNKYSQKLLEKLFDLEYRACIKSDLLVACSEDDAITLGELYKIDKSKLKIVSNGVDIYLNSFLSVGERMKNKEKLGILNEKIVSFIGSWHKPNLEAVEEIFKMAPLLPNVKFMIMGGQCGAFVGREVPKNVALVGIVEENLKNLIYSVTDIAINPMVTGSGTNLKIAEYLAQGIPVITTEVGGRGYQLIDNINIKTSSIEDFPASLNELIFDYKLQEKLSVVGREKVEKIFSWNYLGQSYLEFIKKI